MLTLFYTPGACSLSPHIALREAGIPFELNRVDLRAKKTASGGDYLAVNPKGYVPALQLDNGEFLTEGAAMVQYIADLKPESKLAPPAGTMERVRLQEWLVFIATELHKGTAPLFSPTVPDEYKAAVTEKVGGRLAYVAKQLGDKKFITGDTFTLADGYLFYIFRVWTGYLKQQLPAALAALQSRIAERPAVKAALEAEGFTAQAK